MNTSKPRTSISAPVPERLVWLSGIGDHLDFLEALRFRQRLLPASNGGL
jgi:hypothetical protein